MISKTLADYKSLQTSKADADSELVTKTSLLVKEENYNAELLKAVALLVSSEKRNKSFGRKMLEALEKVLKAATKPEHLATIVTLIVLAKKF